VYLHETISSGKPARERGAYESGHDEQGGQCECRTGDKYRIEILSGSREWKWRPFEAIDNI
jgi:hypothetical protein